mgnify:CR=1 FL=1
MRYVMIFLAVLVVLLLMIAFDVFGNQAGIGPGNRAGQRAVYARALRL